MTHEIFTLTSSPLAILERFLILGLLAILLLWIYSVIRLTYSKRGENPLRVMIHRSFIESALIVIVFLAIYFSFFVKYTGWQRFIWDEWHWSIGRNTYFMILPEILLLVFLSIFFFVQTHKLSNLLKSK